MPSNHDGMPFSLRTGELKVPPVYTATERSPVLSISLILLLILE